MAARTAAIAFLLLALAPPTAAAPRQSPPAAGDGGRAEFLARIETRLKSHPFFRRTTLKRVDDFAPFALYVEPPNREAKNYEAVIAQKYGPWLLKLEAIFRRELVEPLGLVDHGGLPAHALVVLHSRGAYVDYGDATRSLDPNAVRAHYDPELKIAVTYEDEIREAAEHTERAAALHEIVHALQHRFGPLRERLPACVWFNEGLAEYLAFHLSSKPEELERHPIDRYALRDVALAIRAGVPADLALLPVELLVEPRTYEEVGAASARYAAARGVALAPEAALALFYAEASLFVHFLRHGEAGAHRERFGRVMRAVMIGKPPKESFLEAFADMDLAALDAAFRAYVLAEYAREYAPEPTDDLRAALSTARAVDSSAATTAPAVSLESVRAALALDVDEGAIAIEREVARAALGGVDRAAAELEALAASAASAERLRDRARVEAGGARARSEARELFATWIAGASQPLKLALAGKNVSLRVLAVESGALVLAPNPSGVERLALAEIAPADLLQAMPKEFLGAERDWLRLYAYALASNPKARKLAAPGREADALRADSEAFYPAALAHGRAALALEALAARAQSPAASLESSVEAVSALWREHRDVEFVARRAGALARLARAALTDRAVELEPAALLAGRVTMPGGGAIRVTYDFADASHTADFARDDAYLASFRARMPELGFLDPRSAFAPREGGFSGTGATCFRHALALRAPSRVQATVRWEAIEGVPNDSYVFALGACGDAYERHAMCVGLSALIVEDKSGRTQVVDLEGAGTIQLGTNYTLEVRNDGETVEVWIDGVRRGVAPAGQCAAGRAFLWLHSQFRVVIGAFEVEGVLDDQSLAPARRAWVDARMSELGME